MPEGRNHPVLVMAREVIYDGDPYHLAGLVQKMVLMPAKERMTEVVTVVQLGMTTDDQNEDRVAKRTVTEKRTVVVREIETERDAATETRLCVVLLHGEKTLVALQAPLTGQMTFQVARGPAIPEKRM